MVVGQAPAGYVVRDGNPDWAPDGEYPSFFLTEMLQGDDEAIGRELVAILAERSRQAVLQDQLIRVFQQLRFERIQDRRDGAYTDLHIGADTLFRIRANA